MNNRSCASYTCRFCLLFHGLDRWVSKEILALIVIPALREKCPNIKLFLVRIFLCSISWCKDSHTEYLPVFSPNARKCGPG